MVRRVRHMTNARALNSVLSYLGSFLIGQLTSRLTSPIAFNNPPTSSFEGFIASMPSEAVPDYSAVVSATGFLRPRASRSLHTFHDHLITSKRMLALVGAGLSAPSGISTYRGAGGVWQTHDVTQLCTPAGLKEDPALVWTFELGRRSMMKNAQPNVAHRALAALATKNLDFLTLTMNIDDLSERAGHSTKQLHHLHGSIFDVKCSKCDSCISEDGANDGIKAFFRRDLASNLKRDDIPLCPVEQCNGIIRPGIVWFTESIPLHIMRAIYEWISGPADKISTIDTMLVIGTSALVYPATAYIEAARRKGARVAVVDIAQEDPSSLGLEEQDWYFQGDAAELLPKMLNPVIDSDIVSEDNKGA